ncbi:MAG: hypothetical protein HQ532_04580 [Candidatus Omnitrophica bacterium]|nr:hypothetical protein [Candidatus Omnitrophota bacterium]
MKKIWIYVFFLTALGFYYGTSLATEDAERTRSQLRHIERQQSSQHPQPAKPILPPTVPSSSIGASPMLSPHIAAPPINRSPIVMPSVHSASQYPNRPVHSIPSVPFQATVPAAAVPTQLPQIPIIGNSLGEVTDIGSEEDGTPWIEVKDDIFNEILKIKVNSKNVPILKKTTVLNFSDIKIGDMVSVIFNQENEEISATFISIMTKEDLEIIKESMELEPTLLPAEDENSLPGDN